MASGIGKSLAIRECIEGAISAQFTCTVAQNHPKATVICDELATYELKVKTLRYY
jgi:glucosamine-6-phosphate deaminase